MSRRKLVGWIAAAVLTAAMFAVVAVMAGRVDETARFVTWPVVAFTALAACTAAVGSWSERSRPVLFAAGLLVSVPVSYVLPAAPMPVIAVVLVGLGGLAVVAGDGVAGLATGVGALMVLLVVLQGPAVECQDAGVSSNSGPWWVESSQSSSSSSSSSSGSGSVSPGGDASGTTQVGDRVYEYTCRGGHLASFRRVA